jgi:hypothetical protein
MCAAFLVISVILAGELYSQTNNQENGGQIRAERSLGQHFFTPVNQVKSPFLLTSARTSIGIGSISGIEYPQLEIGGNKYYFLEGNIYNAILEFEYQHVVKDWMAVFLEFGLVGRLGSDFGTLISEGISYASSFKIGWMLKVYRAEDFMLSATIEVNNSKYSFISLKTLAEDIENDNPQASLVTDNISLTGIMGLKAAYGFNKLVGATLIADIGYGEPLLEGLANELFVTVGFNADFDFTGITKTPVSVVFGYLFSSYPQGTVGKLFDTNLFFAQLSYIGRNDFIFSLGLIINNELVGNKNQSVWKNSLLFTMKYFF